MSEAQNSRQQPSDEDKAFVERMGAMIRGDVAPPNEQVAYLVAAYKQDSQSLLSLQEAIVKMRGRIESRENDLRHWDSKLQALSDKRPVGVQAESGEA